MRLQELFETTEEDRALISLSSAIYDKIKPYIGNTNDEVIHIGKVGDIFDTPITALNNISVDIQSGEDYLNRSTDTNAGETTGRQSMAFWDSDTDTIVLNSDFIGTERTKTTITHELRHALDDIKSGGFPASPKNKNPEKFNKYLTPKKKEHRKNDPYSTTQYRAQPAEINARFTEVLHKLADLVPKRYNTVEPKLLRRQLMHDFSNLLLKYEIADLFPEKTASRDYKRLVKRAYDFIQKEMSHIEARPGNTKQAIGNW
jgi:hypothetical protein